jgi:hypothetical protein
MKRLVLLVLVACSKPHADPGACYRAKDSACVAYGAETAAAGKSKCVGFEWRTTCPTENRLGTCKSPNTEELLYSGPPNAYDLATAKKVCESNGGTFGP